MRDQLAREREQQEQQAAREADRLARQQAAEEKPQPPAEAPAPVQQPQPDRDPDPIPAAATAAPEHSGPRIPITVHIELRTSVHPGMPDHPIETEVRRILEAAGITTLHSVRIERHANAA